MVFRNHLTNSFVAALSSLVVLGLVGCGTPIDFQRETFTTESATKLEPVADQGADEVIDQGVVPPVADVPAPGLDPSLPELPIPMEPGDDEDEMVPEVAARPVVIPQDAQVSVRLKRVYIVGLRTVPGPQPFEGPAVMDPARKADEQAHLEDDEYPVWRKPVVLRVDFKDGEKVDISNLVKGEEQTLPLIQSGDERIHRAMEANPIFAASVRNITVIALVYRVDRSSAVISSRLAGNSERPLYLRSKYLPFYRGFFAAEDNNLFNLDLAQRKPASAKVKWNHPAAMYMSRLNHHWLFPLWSPRQSALLGISQ